MAGRSDGPAVRFPLPAVRRPPWSHRSDATPPIATQPAPLPPRPNQRKWGEFSIFRPIRRTFPLKSPKFNEKVARRPGLCYTLLSV